MMRIADAIARQTGARALVTGEVVGQVASQTLDNMAIISSATTLPILRPLVGMDKEEITARGRTDRELPDFHHSGPGLLSALHPSAPCHQGQAR